MSIPILATKLFAPQSRPNAVQRPRLIERLNQGLERKLTLVSAPAGFGKTMLISEWIADLDKPVAWLSLDDGDKDLVRFLTYFVAALQTMALKSEAEKIGEGVMNLLQSPQPLSTETILTMLLNEIARIPKKFILILDDYHLVDTKLVDDALIFLLDHLPPQMHLIITTREDPPLPLARYRVKGQLTELRVSDLRFTSSEAAEFFNQVMGLSLSADQIAVLESRTEGWIAGLQLAAISLQDREDPSTFIDAFSGGHHFILDYLIEEVLQQQSEDVRHFLLQTSLLESLNGPLCDAVTEQKDSRKMLGTLENGNLFLIPLDDQRHWYRYHHLFADVLQSRLLEEQPRLVPVLHQRASHWYEQNDRPFDAIRHALAAEDFERAANLIEQLWPSMHRSNLETPELLDLLEMIPDELIHVRPVLSAGYGWMYLNRGDLESAEIHLRAAERWFEAGSESIEMLVVDDEEFQSLPAEVASARAYLALARGDVAGTVTNAQRALDLHSETDHIRRGPPAAILGLAQWAIGELEAAHEALDDAMASFQKAGNIVFALSGTYGLADIRIAQGRLHAAIGVYEQALQLALALPGPVLQGTTDLYLGLADLNYEQGNLELSAQYFAKNEELGELAALPDWPYRVRLVQARIKESEGDFDSALDLLNEAERLYYPTPVPNTRPVAALKARVWIAQSKLTKAWDWARDTELSMEDMPTFLQEFEQITLARLHIAENKSKPVDGGFEKVMSWLDQLLGAAEAGGRMGSVIEILLLQAIVQHRQNNISQAGYYLHRALTLAEPEGYIQLFVKEGSVINRLLSQIENNDLAPDYIQKLLAAFGQEDVKPPIGQSLAEPLSERELEVLRLLGTELTGPEIADRLLVSLNTMRTHTKNIYSKLDVNSRRAAVRRAEELSLN
jgi:LuxR family maltose regulon positive regulatory protein